MNDFTDLIFGKSTDSSSAVIENNEAEDDNGEAKDGLWSPIDDETGSDSEASIADEASDASKLVGDDAAADNDLRDQNPDAVNDGSGDGSHSILTEGSGDDASNSGVTDGSGGDASNSNVTENDTPGKDGTNSELDDAVESSKNEKGILSSTTDINLRDIDGAGTNYLFNYNDEDYRAVYTTDNWKIIDSYKIDNSSDIRIICQALIDIHPIHGSDMVSYRTADDMAYEWVQHNLAYQTLPDDSPLKSHAKDVDLDPNDQNRSFDEIYKDRTGKELDLNDFVTEDDLQKLYDMLSGD